MMVGLKKRRMNRDGLDAHRRANRQNAPGKRTAAAARYRQAELAEEVPQQEHKPAAATKRDAPADPNRQQGAAPHDPAAADQQSEGEKQDQTAPEKELAPSFLPVFDAEPDAEKDPTG
jgi:hypothetical protein